MRERQLSIPVLILLAVLAAFFSLWWRLSWDSYTVDLALQGQEQITLEYGEYFEDPGAVATVRRSFLGLRTVEIPVEITGKVDEYTLGTYRIDYTAHYEQESAAGSRTVTVVDTQSPVIYLSGGAEVQLLPGSEYEEQGYSAFDTCDGNLTGKVEVTRQENTFTYTVVDNSGNRVTATRTIVFNDPEPPELTLLGAENLQIPQGGYFAEPGFAAQDNCDGEITHLVQIQGEVDTFTPGQYILTYTVSDLFGNQISAQRTVDVYAVEGVTVAPYNGKDIYLTFDDGPSKYTPQLLDVLDKYGIKATFFVVNSGREEELARMAEAGHALAIHSSNHRYSQIYSSEEAYFRDLYRIQDTIEGQTGIKTMLLRFPGGSSNTVSRKINRGIMTRLTQQVTELGFTYFDWNVDSMDAGGAKYSSEVFRNVTNGISKNDDDFSVVLQHDVTAFSVNAVERIILWGLENGYRFLPLDEDSPTCHHDVCN